eukprot:TRINITY_DN27191_c0_g1_i1.p1 TRINITY_DN27191_c0_g1~~TRINITY_DN27191_c0_g1_i1.p1  ORF type:complete len:507 (-),score=27.90 TRINITY_DN27191_c0_g1_i1:173-1693(-)
MSGALLVFALCVHFLCLHCQKNEWRIGAMAFADNEIPFLQSLWDEILVYTPALRNRTISITEFPDPYGENGFEALLKNITAGQLEMGLALTTITSNRSRDHLYPGHVYVSANDLAVRLKRTSLHLFSFLDPFDKLLWLALGVMHVLIGAAAWFAETSGDKNPAFPEDGDGPTETPPPGARLVASCVFWSFSILFGTQGTPRSISVRMSTLLWQLFCLVVVTSYTAQLTSSLTTAAATASITSIEDARRLPVAVVQGTAQVEAASVLGLERLVEAASPAEAASLLISDKVKGWFAEDTLLDDFISHQAQNNCDFTIIRNRRAMAPVSFPIAPTESDVAWHLQTTLLKLGELGIIDRLRSQYLVRSTHTCDPSGSTGKYTFPELLGIFVVAFAAILLSISDGIRVRYRKKKKQKHAQSANQEGSRATQYELEMQPPTQEEQWQQKVMQELGELKALLATSGNQQQQTTAQTTVSSNATHNHYEVRVGPTGDIISNIITSNDGSAPSNG